jgi:hypothetical protein
LFNTIGLQLDSNHNVNPPLIIDANDNDNDDRSDRDNTPVLSIDENIDPQLNKHSSGKLMKGKRKTSDSDKLISILQERYAVEDERNQANREAEEQREVKRQKVAAEKDDRWFELFSELVRQKG